MKKRIQVSVDLWQNKTTMRCETCQWFLEKELAGSPGQEMQVGRCRRHAPTMGGFPVVFLLDWCGDHKLGRSPAS